MPLLRTRLQNRPETAQDFEIAAESRYWEGVELSCAGRSYAAIYLLGYAAEIYLKLASLHLDGLRPTDPIKPRLPPARDWMSKYAPAVSPESYHSLIFWSTLLRVKRRWQGRPLDFSLEAGLTQRVRRIYGNWWVEMRYRHETIAPRELQSAYDDVTWLRNHYFWLWR